MQFSLAAYLSSITATAVAFSLAGIAWCRRGKRGRSALPESVKEQSTSATRPAGLELFDAVADGIVVADAAGSLLYWNSAALRLHGFTENDHVHRPSTDFLETFIVTRPEDGQPIPPSERPLARMLRGEQVRGLELNVRRTDTGRAWVICCSGAWVDSPLDGGAGPGQTEKLIVLTLQDMTDLRRSDAALRQSELHLRETIETLPQLVWACRGDDGACDYLSRQFIEYTGIAASDQLGFGWLNQVHPEDHDQAIDEWRRAAAQGSRFDIQFRLRRADGAYRWFRALARPLHDAQGRVVRWFGTNTDIHDAREAARSIEALAAIVEHTGDVVIGTSLDGTIRSWNRAAERIYGYAAGEAIGRDFRMLMPDGDVGHGEVDALLAEVVQGRGVERVESRRVRRDGHVIDVSLTVSPVRDASGRVNGASMIARDVTESKRDAAALRTSEARFRQLASSMPQIVWTSDTHGRTTYLNEQWFRVTGLEEAGPEQLARVVHPDDLALLLGAWNTAEASGRGYSVEFRMRHVSAAAAGAGADSGYRWFLARAVPIQDAHERVTEWFGTSTDIDDLKRAESLARDNEARLRGVLDSLLVYVAVLDPQGKLVGLNRAARDLMVRRGVEPDVLQGHSLLDSALPALAPEAAPLLRGGLEQAAWGEEVRLESLPLIAGASPLDVDLMISPMRGADGRITHLIVSGVDVTERERAARQARERQAELAHLDRVRTMGQMAAGLAHELNQPLGAIANYAGACRRLLDAGRSAPADLANVLGDVQSEALRAGEIIRRLRAFVAKQQPKAMPLEVNQLIEDSVRLLAYDLRAAGVEPRLSLVEGLSPVLADPVQVGQVLVNLIRNALDAMEEMEPARRVLEIATTVESPQHVRITVRDRGCGVPPEDLARVFDAFFTTKSGGLGIGLALCRTIIEDHGGHLWAEPNGDGGGMTFAFTLKTSAPTHPTGEH